MSNVSQISENGERKEKRRLHLREIAQDQDSDLPPAASVGATLRAARMARGEEATTIAAALKMRLDQLDAIESDDFARLPGRTYAIGFLRSYARYLELDADALIQKYKDDSAGHEVNKPVELVFPQAAQEQRLPNGSILIVALVIAMVIYGVSYLTMPNRKTPAASAKADVPPVVVVQPAVAPPATRPGTEAVVQPAAPAPALNAMTAEPEAPTTFVAGNTGLPPPPSPQAAAPTGLTQAIVDAPLLSTAMLTTGQQKVAAAAPGTVSGNSNNVRVTLKALQPTYIRIRDLRQPGQKGILLDRILNPGESFQPPDRAGLVMQTGNAGGLQVEVDGRSVGVLGKSGEVITRIPVDPSYFLERMAATQ